MASNENKLTNKDLNQLNDSLHSCITRLMALESKLCLNELNRVKRQLLNDRMYGVRMERVPANYYDLSLIERANILRCNTSQLCKSIIFENTSCSHFNVKDPKNSRYYCVVLQYEGM